MQFKPWRWGLAMFRELRRLGASADLAASIAAKLRCWRHGSALALHRVLPRARFDSLGVRRFS